MWYYYVDKVTQRHVYTVFCLSTLSHRCPRLMEWMFVYKSLLLKLQQWRRAEPAGHPLDKMKKIYQKTVDKGRQYAYRHNLHIKTVKTSICMDVIIYRSWQLLIVLIVYRKSCCSLDHWLTNICYQARYKMYLKTTLAIRMQRHYCVNMKKAKPNN